MRSIWSPLLLFDHKGWHFITLDDIVLTEGRSYEGRIDSIQLEWLKKKISAKLQIQFRLP